jgi:hypothetical protein
MVNRPEGLTGTAEEEEEEEEEDDEDSGKYLAENCSH